MKFISEITNDNVQWIMKVADIRHLDGVRCNFIASETDTWLQQP